MIDLFFKLVPLYLIIVIGFLAGKNFGVTRESIAPLLLYFVVPVVNFKGVFTTEINLHTMLYPVFHFVIGMLLGVGFYNIGKFVYRDREEAALLSLSSSLANVGYFGIPFLLSILGEQILGVTVVIILGLTIYENTIGYFIAARGKHSLGQALRKTLKLPVVYAVILAVIANKLYGDYYLHLDPSSKVFFDPLIESLLTMMDKFVGALTFLGMLMVGLGLAKIQEFKFNWSFISLSFLAKFVCFPLLSILIIYLDESFFNILSEQARQVVFYISLVPIGANTITLATQLGMDTDNASITVVLSTVFALFFIPLCVSFGIFA